MPPPTGLSDVAKGILAAHRKPAASPPLNLSPAARQLVEVYNQHAAPNALGRPIVKPLGLQRPIPTEVLQRLPTETRREIEFAHFGKGDFKVGCSPEWSEAERDKVRLFLIKHKGELEGETIFSHATLQAPEEHFEVAVFHKNEVIAFACISLDEVQYVKSTHTALTEQEHVVIDHLLVKRELVGEFERWDRNKATPLGVLLCSAAIRRIYYTAFFFLESQNLSMDRWISTHCGILPITRLIAEDNLSFGTPAISHRNASADLPSALCVTPSALLQTLLFDGFVDEEAPSLHAALVIKVSLPPVLVKGLLPSSKSALSDYVQQYGGLLRMKQHGLPLQAYDLHDPGLGAKRKLLLEEHMDTWSPPGIAADFKAPGDKFGIVGVFEGNLLLLSALVKTGVDTVQASWRDHQKDAAARTISIDFMQLCGPLRDMVTTNQIGRDLYKNVGFQLLRAIPSLHRKHGPGQAGDVVIHASNMENPFFNMLRTIGFKNADGFQLSAPHSHLHSVFMPVAELEKVWNAPAPAVPREGQQRTEPV